VAAKREKLEEFGGCSLRTGGSNMWSSTPFHLEEAPVLSGTVEARPVPVEPSWQRGAVHCLWSGSMRIQTKKGCSGGVS